MASSMSPELQNTFENTWAYEMNQQLKEMFQAKANKERLDVVKSLMACKHKHGASICTFVLEMKGYFDRLKSLNMVFDAEISINIILSSLPSDYNKFTLSYQMNRKETSIMKLYSLLQTAEKGHTRKVRWSKRKAESEIAPTSDPKEAMCFYYNTKGHWKRSCLKYLKDLKDGKVEKGGHSGEYLSIEFFEYLKNYSIVSQLTSPRTPQLNSVAERRNRTLLDMVQSTMCRATLTISFWGYALEIAAHILKLVPTKKVSKIPFEMWKGKCPSLGHIKI
ncbi:retrotransposon protein, putative, ty1-copia subclass [Tanacetum coccineum]|uniref:Retrotransposon protein, putative, ty1-copia subclass n=1 Tax=Tanacetum coccineum TaxID=301880 RepID=A0ABQ5B3R9_9ASTR